MSTIKRMLSVVMDGIKDAEMTAEYAEEAVLHGADHGVVMWFTSRAQTRTSMAERDWHEVRDHIHDEKKHDDELMEALECHVNRSLASLKERVSKL